jgi:hypothetical protein
MLDIYEDILTNSIVNTVNQYTGLKAYKICKEAALINSVYGRILSSTNNFNVNNYNNLDIKKQ